MMSLEHIPSLVLGQEEASDSLWTRLWFRSSGSTVSDGTDLLFFYIFWVSMAFFVLLMFLMVYWGVKYRRRPGEPAVAEPSPAHNTRLELTWSVVPSILMLVMFVWGAYGYLKLVVAPAGSEAITVEAAQWNWKFNYPNGASSLETEVVSDVEAPLFALPVGKPVEFVMSSTDVIHSFYIPGFRIKRDVFPNRYTSVWAQATKVTHTYDAELERTVKLDGRPDYYLFCAEYCGDQHSQMANRIAVLDKTDYAAWLEKQLDTSGIGLRELGEKLVKANGCLACHKTTSEAGTGPGWGGIWDEARPPVGGQSAAEAKVGFNYIRESILEPAAYIRSGFSNQMPTYQGKFTNREVLALATYIMSLSEDYAEEAQGLSDREMEVRGEDGAPPDAERVFSGEGLGEGQ